MASMNATVSASDLNAYKDAYINKAESDMNLNALNIKKSQEKAFLYRMWLTSLVFIMPAFSIGMTMSYSVVGLTFYLRDEEAHEPGGATLGERRVNSTAEEQPTPSVGQDVVISQPAFSIDEDQASWFVSILSLMLMVGTMLSGSVTEKIGCLWTLRLSMSVELTGWILVTTASSFPFILIGRVFNGVGCGLSLPAAYIMLTDISLIRFRGIFAVLNSSACNVGFLAGLIVGAFGSFQTVILCCLAPSTTFILLSVFVPESPLWLVKHNKEEKAGQVIQHIRGPDYSVRAELKELVANASSNTTDNYSFKDVLKAVGKREFLAPFFSLLFLVTVQGFSGCDTLSYYSVMIFKKANINLDEYFMSIVLQAGFTAGYLTIAPFMDSIDRKKLFVSACLTMALSLAVLGVTLHDFSDDFTASIAGTFLANVMTYAPAVSTFMFSYGYGAGFGPAIYTWTSEIFPAKTKSLGTSITLGFRNVVVFGLLKMYPMLISSMGLSNIMYFHAVWLVVGLTFVQACMPETRGLTMTQISAVFSGKPLEKSARKHQLHSSRPDIIVENVEASTPEEDDLLQDSDSPPAFCIDTKT